MRIAVSILLIALASTVFAQRQVPLNLPKYDYKKLRFGYSLGYSTLDFTIRNSGSFLTPEFDTVFSIENQRLPGFHLAIISELHLVNYLDLRFLPGLTFGSRDLKYLIYDKRDQKYNVHTMQIESTFLDFPLLLKYSSKRLNNYRVYLLGGGSFRYDLAAQKEISPQERPKIRLRAPDYYYEIGFGLDYFLEYFKFSTEIKMGVGMTNILVPDGTQFTTSIERMNSKLVSVSLHFEGGKYDGMQKFMGKLMWWRN